MTLAERERTLKAVGDKIITFEYVNDKEEDVEIFLTSTTISEQNERSYFVATSVGDQCLFPQDKMFMLFELLNTVPRTLDA